MLRSLLKKKNSGPRLWKSLPTEGFFCAFAGANATFNIRRRTLSALTYSLCPIMRHTAIREGKGMDYDGCSDGRNIAGPSGLYGFWQNGARSRWTPRSERGEKGRKEDT